jgi:hypothetical protein
MRRVAKSEYKGGERNSNEGNQESYRFPVAQSCYLAAFRGVIHRSSSSSLERLFLLTQNVDVTKGRTDVIGQAVE